MRQKNLRLVIVGAVMMIAAVGFFLGMGTMAPKSNNPAALMQTVGQCLWRGRRHRHGDAGVRA